MHDARPANIRENVTLSADGNSYSGSFSIDQYDTQLNLKAHIIGNINAPASPSTPSPRICSRLAWPLILNCQMSPGTARPVRAALGGFGR